MGPMRIVLLGLCLSSFLSGAPRDSRTAFDLLSKGKRLVAEEAAKLEERLVKKPNDEETRIQLLGYYAGMTAEISTQSRASRLGHLLWVVGKDPKEGFGLFQIGTGVLEMHCQGDGLADPEGFQQLKDLWLRQLEKYPRDPQMSRQAAKALRYCLPETAERILLAAGDLAGLGSLYAEAVLGITGRSYDGYETSGADAMLRQNSFAEKARRMLVESTDKEFLPAAARTLLHEGATLWAKGKLDWDYTPLGNQLLTRAKVLAPDNVFLFTVPTALPAPGELPAATLRVGGNVQQAKLVKSVSPIYPSTAREARIEGTVRVTALLGLDGKVVKLKLESGPPELVDASLAAVQQWEYKTTLLNGKPCYIVTLIDVNYTLR